MKNTEKDRMQRAQNVGKNFGAQTGIRPAAGSAAGGNLSGNRAEITPVQRPAAQPQNVKTADETQSGGQAGQQTGQTQSAQQTAQPQTASAPASNGSYTPSQEVMDAWNYLQEQQKARPGDYQNRYNDQIQDIYNRIMNGEQFNFDLNSNALYQQYRDQYIANGRRAMQDTMGQAAGLTGGYGSSYSQAVGQQQYDEYLRQLNEIVPQLYQQEYQMYRDRLGDLKDQYGMAVDAEGRDYDRWGDAYNRWLQEMGLARDAYNSEREYNWNQYTWNQDYALQREQWEWQKQQAAAAAARSGGSGGGSGSRSGGQSSNSYSKAEMGIAENAYSAYKSGNYDGMPRQWVISTLQKVEGYTQAEAEQFWYYYNQYRRGRA